MALTLRPHFLNSSCRIHQILILRNFSLTCQRCYRKEMIDRIIRVDHAGEIGADRIYAGQLAVLGTNPVGSTIKHMWDQEKHHLATFESFLTKYDAKPSVLVPLCNIAGFVLGAGTAVLGTEAAMACTVAVEEVIGEHYNSQIRELVEDNSEENKELLETISKFRDEELEHYETGLNHNAEKAPMYKVMSEVIKIGCKGAIWLAERI